MKLGGSYTVSLATGLLTFIILIFGEISPKTAATIHAEKLALFVAPLIYFLMTVLTPVIFIINSIAGLFLRLIGINPNQKQETITEEELRTFVDVSH